MGARGKVTVIRLRPHMVPRWFSIMTEFSNVKVPVDLLKTIDRLVEIGLYVSRGEYIREVIRNDLRERNLEVNV